MYEDRIDQEIEFSVLALGVAYASVLVWMICCLAG